MNNKLTIATSFGVDIQDLTIVARNILLKSIKEDRPAMGSWELILYDGLRKQKGIFEVTEKQWLEIRAVFPEKFFVVPTKRLELSNQQIVWLLNLVEKRQEDMNNMDENSWDKDGVWSREFLEESHELVSVLLLMKGRD